MKNKQGFTMVELSLSIVFIAVLSVTVVILINNAVSSYHKGITFNQLNTAGMAIVEDIRTTIQGSPATEPKSDCTNEYSGDVVNDCEEDEALSFVYMEQKATVTYKDGSSVINDGDSENKNSQVPIYGVFCTGAYSYLWNSGYLDNDDYNVDGNSGGMTLTYNNGPQKSSFRLLKVEDKNRQVCKIAATSGEKEGESSEGYRSRDENTMPNQITITEVVNEEPIDLLEGNNNLRVYKLTSSAPAKSSSANSMFYAVSLTLGTLRGGIDAVGNNCVAPEDNNLPEDFDYCAINNFNFAAMASGG